MGHLMIFDLPAASVHGGSLLPVLELALEDGAETMNSRVTLGQVRVLHPLDGRQNERQVRVKQALVMVCGRIGHVEHLRRKLRSEILQRSCEHCWRP